MQVVVRSMSMGVVPATFVRKSFYYPVHKKRILDYSSRRDRRTSYYERVCRSTQVLIQLASLNGTSRYLFERDWNSDLLVLLSGACPLNNASNPASN